MKRLAFVAAATLALQLVPAATVTVMGLAADVDSPLPRPAGVGRGAGGEGGSLAVFPATYHLLRPDGSTVQVRFEVAADSAEQADAAANAALSTLAPEASIRDSVSGAWLPWPWKWDPGELPVDVAYNPEGAPPIVGPSAIIAGLQAWSNAEGSAFRFHYAGITDNTASILELGPDGENVISWRALPCERGCVLGVTSKENGHEVDMVLNSNPAAAEQLGVGTKVDWRTVILHELGHMAGLEHSCPVPFGPCTDPEADAVMYFQYRGTLRKLAPDDVAGIAALYPADVPVPTSPPGSTPASSPTPSHTVELVVLLEPGWNLVLLPPGEVTTAAEALPCLEAVYDFNDGEWQAWIRGALAALQDITSVESARGYWALADSACARSFE